MSSNILNNRKCSQECERNPLCHSFHGHCRNYRHFCQQLCYKFNGFSTWIAYAKSEIYGCEIFFRFLWFCPTRGSFKQMISIFPTLLFSRPTIIIPPDQLGLYGKRGDWRTLARKTLFVCNPLIANYKCIKLRGQLINFRSLENSMLNPLCFRMTKSSHLLWQPNKER